MLTCSRNRISKNYINTNWPCWPILKPHHLSQFNYFDWGVLPWSFDASQWWLLYVNWSNVSFVSHVSRAKFFNTLKNLLDDITCFICALFGLKCVGGGAYGLWVKQVEANGLVLFQWVWECSTFQYGLLTLWSSMQ